MTSIVIQRGEMQKQQREDSQQDTNGVRVKQCICKPRGSKDCNQIPVATRGKEPSALQVTEDCRLLDFGPGAPQPYDNIFLKIESMFFTSAMSS